MGMGPDSCLSIKHRYKEEPTPASILLPRVANNYSCGEGERSFPREKEQDRFSGDRTDR
jgi:hypothetical protein